MQTMFALKALLLILYFISISAAAQQDVFPVRLPFVVEGGLGENQETCPLSEKLDEVNNDIAIFSRSNSRS